MPAVCFREPGHFRVLAQLQRPDVRRDGPAIDRRHLDGVVSHGAVTVSDHVEEVPNWSRTQALDMERRGRAQAALHDHALTVSNMAVTGRAIDVVALLSPPQ